MVSILALGELDTLRATQVEQGPLALGHEAAQRTVEDRASTLCSPLGLPSRAIPCQFVPMVLCQHTSYCSQPQLPTMVLGQGAGRHVAAASDAEAVAGTMAASRPVRSAPDIKEPGNRVVLKRIAQCRRGIFVDALVMSRPEPERAFMPHVPPNTRRLEAGSVVILTRQAPVNSYPDQCERTYFINRAVGGPTAGVRGHASRPQQATTERVTSRCPPQLGRLGSMVVSIEPGIDIPRWGGFGIPTQSSLLTRAVRS